MSEVPAQSVPLHLSPMQLEYQLRLQKVETWHLAFKCPGCGFIQSAETMKRAGFPFSAIDIRPPVTAYTCAKCKGSLLNGETALSNLQPKIIVVESWPYFEPATPEEAQALKQSWRK